MGPLEDSYEGKVRGYVMLDKTLRVRTGRRITCELFPPKRTISRLGTAPGYSAKMRIAKCYVMLCPRDNVIFD